MKHFHLVGIGGAGLSAIARVLLESGQLVSGSDEQETEFTARLRASGVRIFIRALVNDNQLDRTKYLKFVQYHICN